MKKYKWNIVLAIIMACIMMGVIFGVGEPQDVIKSVKLLDTRWILIGIICIVLYLGVETAIQYMLTTKMQKGHSKWNAFKVVMTGQFFNAITPFASGGQPMQAFMMSKQGVPVGTSVSILMTKFIVYQVVLSFYSVIVLFLELSFFNQKIQGVVYVALIGFIINFGVATILLASVFMKNTLIKIGLWIVDLLHKIRILKKTDKIKNHIIEQVELFNINIKLLTSNIGLLLKISTLTVMQLTLYFMIPYFIYKAFGLDGTKAFIIISAAAFIVMISSFIPIPGGTGVAEGSFYIFFGLFLPDNILPAAIICWRLLTFYIPLCIGGIMTVLPDKVVVSKSGGV